MWRHLRAEAIKRPTPLLIGIASFWSTFLMTGMFNIQQALYGFWFLIALMTIQRDAGVDGGFPRSGQLRPLFESEQGEGAVS